jgi:hypothetical protein
MLETAIDTVMFSSTNEVSPFNPNLTMTKSAQSCMV